MAQFKIHPTAQAASMRGGSAQTAPAFTAGSKVGTLSSPGPPLPAPRPVSHPVVPRPGVGVTLATGPPRAAPATSEYLNVRQKQPDGTWKVVSMNRTKLSADQIRAAQASILNNREGLLPGAVGGSGVGMVRPGTPAPLPAPGGLHPSVMTDPRAPGGGIGANPTGAAPTAAAPTVAAPGAAPSWIPPMIGLGGLNADPLTGRIDWKSLIDRAGGVAAADPTYAADLSNAIMQSMQSVSAPQSEISALTTIDPTTGKTLYQTLAQNALQKYGQANSSSMGNAAARGIGSSGMMNQNLGQLAVGNQQQQADIYAQQGQGRIKALVDQITQQLGAQDQQFANAYYSSLARAQAGLPAIGG